MKCFIIISHEEEIDTPDGGEPTEWITVKNMINFKSFAKALIYLQEHICDGNTRKPMNLRTLDAYKQECRIFCFPSVWKKGEEKKVDIWEEKYR